jgi:hypothetical protein
MDTITTLTRQQITTALGDITALDIYCIDDYIAIEVDETSEYDAEDRLRGLTDGRISTYSYKSRTVLNLQDTELAE